MSEDKKIILVTGATGTQGGSVIRNLADKGYELRALTRNPESEKALALKTSGVNVFKGDMNDPESLKEPLDGAYGVFSVQNFWEAGNEGEITLGKAIATSAKEADVKHF
ncbi:MAG: NmrA family NAD(P)-binding protein, partial [Candidatus Marinimicrobia bacterium]|nr:NmrA family NAD(P)-binding protein [Candidatus Neomarinimicrobiota bacterium]